MEGGKERERGETGRQEARETKTTDTYSLHNFIIDYVVLCID